MTLYLFYTFLLAFMIQVAGFTFGYLRQSDHLTDLLYGFSFLILAWWARWYVGNMHPLVLCLVMMISLWAVRLSGYLFWRIKKIKKDTRFDSMRKSFWKLGGFWLLQASTIWIVMLPSLIYITQFYTSNNLNNTFTVVGFLTFTIGLFIETIADYQKSAFKSKPQNKDTWISTGLWYYCRYPNYLGEILCWIGIFIFCMPVLKGWAWLTVISPLWIILLLTKVSGIPLLEKRYEEKFGDNTDYQAYKKSTNRLIPKV